MTATPSPGEITELLRAVRKGDDNAASKLVPLIYDRLRRLARSYFRKERPDHTLQPTALVNDALVQLLETNSIDWRDRAHFYAITANVMRRILIDYARAHQAQKRGTGCEKLSLDVATVVEAKQFPQLLILDAALSSLQLWDARQAKVVELRFFAGMTEEEIAEAMGTSIRTVKRDWKMARAWLHREMTK
jgi:RNA polymerase sigma-70 factor (ECF subfamily)